MHGCETWSLTMREEYRLRVFMNRVLGQMFRPKGEEVTEEWRMLHCMIYILTKYYWVDQIEKNEMGWTFCMYEGEEVKTVLAG